MFRKPHLGVVLLALAAMGCGKTAGGRQADPYERGIRAYAARDYQQAVADLTDALRRDPQDASAYHYRGLAHFALKDYENAVKDQSDAIRHDVEGDLVEYYLSRGRAQEKRQRYRDALLDYEDAARNASDDGAALNELAWLLATCPDAAVRDGRRAVELAKKACELEPLPTFWDTLAAAHAEAGNFADAVAWQEKALATPDQGIEDDLAGAKERLRLYQEAKPFRAK